MVLLSFPLAPFLKATNFMIFIVEVQLSLSATFNPLAGARTHV